MRLSLPSASRNGTSSAQGTHHDAQTLTKVTLSLNAALLSPGTGLPSTVSPGSGGRSVTGAGLPINADGSRDGSPEPSPT